MDGVVGVGSRMTVVAVVAVVTVVAVVAVTEVGMGAAVQAAR